jgi:uncharacterized protein (TIGR02594 family)
MVQLFASRRSLRIVALALCSAAIVASVTPASARSRHGAGRRAYVHHTGWHGHRHYRHMSRAAPPDAEARMQAQRLARANAGPTSRGMATSGGFGSSDVVAEARRYIGGNPTGRGRLWCARFMNLVLERSGHRGTGSDMARSFASYGQRLPGPQIGAIVVMGRRGGGHVGVVSGIDADGDPIVVSGNNGNRVREAVLSRSRIYAYVMPTS